MRETRENMIEKRREKRENMIEKRVDATSSGHHFKMIRQMIMYELVRFERKAVDKGSEIGWTGCDA